MSIYAPNPESGNELVIYSALPGGWKGCAFNIESKYLQPNQARFLANMGPSNNGSALRPSPGQKPIANSYSFRHNGVLDFTARDKFDKMSVWIITDTEGADPILGLFNHATYLPGSGKAHPYPDEFMLLDGAPPGLNARVFRNYAPLISRNSDYTFDFDGGTIFTGLLDVSAEGSWVGWQRTAETPTFQVLATDTNPLVSIGPGATSDKISIRQFGLNAPQFDPGNSASLPVATETPLGPQIPMRLASGSAGTGPADFTLDPDAEWDLQNGSIVEFDLGYPVGTNSLTAEPDAKIFIAAPAKTGTTFTSSTFSFQGTWADPETKEIAYSTGADDPVAVTAISGATDAAGTTVSQWLWVRWDTNYVSANAYRVDVENPNNFTYPRAVFANSGDARLTRLVAHKGGKPIRRDNEVSRWFQTYLWKKKVGNYVVRGGHSGTYERFTGEAGAGTQFVMLGSFGPPLESEEPTHMEIAYQAFNVGVRQNPEAPRGSQDLDRNGGIGSGMAVVREVPIHRVSIPNNTWETNTGFPNHDIDLTKAVVWNWLDDIEIAGISDIVPGGLIALGGCAGVAAIGPYTACWGFPKFKLSSVTISDGTVAEGLKSTRFQSTTDDFKPWFIGRELVFKGESYTVRRVTVERASLTSTLFVYEKRGVAADASSDEAFLSEDRSTIWFSMGGNLYGENFNPFYSGKVPGGEEITSVIGTGSSSAVVTTREGTVWELVVTPTGNIFTEDVQALNFDWSRRTSSHGAAGSRGLTLMEDFFVADTGRNISSGRTPTNMEDITSDDNSRVFTDLLNPAQAKNRNLAYDKNIRSLVLSNIETLQPTYAGIPDYGVRIDKEEKDALSLHFPWCGRATGVATLPRPQSTVFSKTRNFMSRWNYGAIVMFVDISTVGTDPITGVDASKTGPYIVVYDTRSGVWSGIYVGDQNTGDFVPAYEGTMEPFAGDKSGPTPGTHSTTQTADGKIICRFGTQPQIGIASFAWIVRLVRSSTGSWSLDPDQATYQFGGFPDTFALAPNRNGSFYALRRLQPTSSIGPMAVADYDNDSVVYPYAAGVGGRQAELVGDPFTFEDSDTDNNCIQALLLGPSGEILVFGYVYVATVSEATPGESNTGGGDVEDIAAEANSPTETWTLTCTDDSTPGSEVFSVSGSVSGAQSDATVGVAYDNGIVSFTIADGTPDFVVGDTFTFTRTLSGDLTIRRLDPTPLAPIGDDAVLSISDPGDPNDSNYGTGAPARGPRSFAINRHGEVWFTERKATNGTGSFPKVSLNRYRFSDNGYTAETSSANTTLTGAADLATPEGLSCLCIDQRQVTWFAVDKDMGSGRIGFTVRQYAEPDTPFNQVDIDRSGFDRRLQSMVCAGNNVWYLVKDTPTGGGTSEWRLIKAIGSNTDIDGDPTGDGTPYVISGTSSPQTEDAGSNSIFFDLASTIAGSGGAITYATCDTQMERATAMPDDANGTVPMRHFGLGAL